MVIGSSTDVGVPTTPASPECSCTQPRESPGQFPDAVNLQAPSLPIPMETPGLLVRRGGEEQNDSTGVLAVARVAVRSQTERPEECVYEVRRMQAIWFCQRRIHSGGRQAGRGSGARLNRTRHRCRTKRHPALLLHGKHDGKHPSSH